MGTCICYDGNFDKCPHPEAVKTLEINGYKGEESTFKKYCEYQLYVGAPFIISNFTREEANKIMEENTLCTY